MNRALEWLLFRMNSQMIEQIMPFLKLFTAVRMITHKKLGPPIGLRVVKLEVSIILQFWYVDTGFKI